MAVDLCSETSPRISFSYDLVTQTDIEHQNRSRLDSSLLIDSNFDFEFNIHHDHESSSSADELFFNGLILPIQIQERKKSDTLPKRRSLPPRPELSSTPSNSSMKECMKKTAVANFEPDEEKPHHTKSFWGFSRSTSLNGGCENISKMSLIFALPILSRSRSTGSASSSTSSSMKHNSHKVPTIPMLKSNNNNNNSASNGFYACKTKQQKVKKKYASSYGQVLNVPPPYISKRAASLFGLGSFFNNDTKNKKLS